MRLIYSTSLPILHNKLHNKQNSKLYNAHKYCKHNKNNSDLLTLQPVENNSFNLQNLLDNNDNGLYKEQLNLPARLMSINITPSNNINIPHINSLSQTHMQLPQTYTPHTSHTSHIPNIPNILNSHMPINKSQSSYKSVSSSYSSVMQDGHTRSKGKKIVNDSNKPYLQVDEMENGNTQHYMIPKNTINYQQPSQIPQPEFVHSLARNTIYKQLTPKKVRTNKIKLHKPTPKPNKVKSHKLKLHKPTPTPTPTPKKVKSHKLKLHKPTPKPKKVKSHKVKTNKIKLHKQK